MHTRPKHEVASDIELTREVLPIAWKGVVHMNPVAVAARATKTAAKRWRGQAVEKKKEVNHRLRANPYLFVVAAVLVGAVIGLVGSALMRKKNQT